MIIGTETAREIVLNVAASLDYDIYKFLVPESSEDPEAGDELLTEAAEGVRMFLKGVSE